MKWSVGIVGILVGCAPATPVIPVGEPAIRLESSAFQDGQAIPRVSTCDGPNKSPPLAWSGVPDSARSLVLICEDPDAPMGTWSHWVLFDIPPHVTNLPANLPQGARIPLAPDGPEVRQGTNDFGGLGYGGPCPPSGTHHYVFQLYALDAAPDLPDSPTRPQVLQAIRGHVVAAGQLVGVYSR